VEEMAAACAGITTSMYVNELGAEPITLMGTEDQKQRFLAPLTQQFKLISFATSEPGMGSDVAGIQATCERQGGDFLMVTSSSLLTGIMLTYS
jgi:acyl-CoA dehydrogenase